MGIIEKVEQQSEISTAASLPVACFHCGLPVPAGTSFRAEVDGLWRAMCCPGCEAIAQSITDRGLVAYYRLRDANGNVAGDSPADARPDAGAQESLALYDDPLVQARFVRQVDGRLEAELLLEGLSCAACAWLVGQTLARVKGVSRADVIYANRRARVSWDPALTRLSLVLAAVRAVGYRAWPYEEGRLALINKRERRAALWRLFVAGFGMMQVMMYALPVYIADAGTMGLDAEQLMRWASLILTLPVMLYSATPFFLGAWRDLRRRPFSLGMDVPVAIGIAVAFGASTWSTLIAAGPVYFDSVSMFVFLLLGGRYLELLARQRAGQSLQHLARLVPETAHRLISDTTGGDAETVPVVMLKPGDRVLVKPGEAIPTDGLLQGARALVNEALVSGESRAVRKSDGDPLIGGAINAGSALIMQVTHIGADTVLSSISRLMERAITERPRWVDVAQRAASGFVIAILLFAAVAALAWMTIDPTRALWIAVSVLIVTCPCALSLATPVALTVATGELARRGLVITRGHVIESLAEATDFVFDKTGTLTRGQLQLIETLPLGRHGAARCLEIAAAIERGSEHPFARALVMAAGGERIPGTQAWHNVPGQGVEALVQGQRHRIGRADYVGALHGRAPPVAWLHSMDSVVWLGDESGWLAAFRLGDGLRARTPEAVAALRGMGRHVHLLSGDDPQVALHLADVLGIARANVTGGASPESKLDYVRNLQRAGARVVMVGDGVNDAPVLAQADVSVAMASGADLTQIKADAVLLSDSPAALVSAVVLARRAQAVVRQNLIWALGYNLIVLPLAFAGMVTPLIAGIGMSSSSLVVVLNALRLRHARVPKSIDVNPKHA